MRVTSASARMACRRNSSMASVPRLAVDSAMTSPMFTASSASAVEFADVDPVHHGLDVHAIEQVVDVDAVNDLVHVDPVHHGLDVHAVDDRVDVDA